PLLPCGTQRAGYRQARSLDLRLRRLRARSGRLRRLLLGPVLELDAASAAGGQLPALLRRYLGVAEARTEHGHSSNRAVPSAAPHGLAPRGGRGSHVPGRDRARGGLVNPLYVIPLFAYALAA